MKSYSQFSEGVEEVRLKEWEKLDEGTKKEIVKQFAEENNIELDEENLEVFEEAVATAMATSPLWLPPLLKAGAWTAGILGTGWAANKHLKNREERKNAETFLQSKELPKSSRTNQQRDQTANANKENQNLENKNNKEEIKNQRESEKINKQLQNRNENPNNPNKKPGLGKRFKNFIKNNPLKTIGAGAATTYGGLGALNWYGNKYHNKNNNNGNGKPSSNNNNGNGKPNPADKW